MNIYWYWPHPHRSPSTLADAMLRPGDTLTVQCLKEFRGETLSSSGFPYPIVRDLPYNNPIPGEPRLKRFWKSFSVGVSRCRRRRRLLRSNHPDLIHLQQMYYLTDWVDLRTLARRYPLVAIVHDAIPHDRRIPASLELLLHRLIYRRKCIPHLIVHHQSVSRILVERFGVDQKRLHLLPIACDHIDRQERSPRTERKQERTVLFIGSLRENKGLQQYLEALKGLRIDNVRFLIVGTGSRYIEQMVLGASKKIPGVCAEIGFYSLERKRQLLSEADFVILPYTSGFTSQSAVLMDAYTYGVPVIATDVGGIGETIREEGTGWLASPDDPSSLKETISRALYDTEEYMVIKNNLEHAAVLHDAKNVGLELRKIYDRVLGCS
jgi:glycosyltransferase involved in cell wall biosynthesis